MPGSFFRFGMGPRKCLGYRYAQAISRVVVTSFVQKRTFQLSRPGATLKVKAQGVPCFTPYLCPQITFNDRQKSSD